MSYGSAGLDEMIGGSGGGLGNPGGDAGAGGGPLNSMQLVKSSLERRLTFPSAEERYLYILNWCHYFGGAGSGGSIKLIGSSIENLGSLDVRGGDAAGADSREPGVRYLGMLAEQVVAASRNAI